MTRRSGTAGFSVVELLACTLFLALFALAMQRFCRTVVRGVRVLEAASEAQEAARLATQLIVADLREAGYGPTGGLGNGLRRASPDEVEIARDLSGDGDVDDTNERVGYHYDAVRSALLRSQGGAPPQPFLSDISADGVRFSYRADDGAALGAGDALDDTTRTRVRRIDVHIVVAIPHPDPAFRQPIRIGQDGVASLRNG
jgi:hypothetical protein